ncbi:MAG: Phospho-N-acetylmuramoyl-pentapeptide-transferase [candidate division TM6 bacterium GW2011_GWE2_41_16]|nr:MAG: Phospho-N-acetylmuramoyl-pentapeptide-transferase [candidate division TM6 bacterium GW2011_GWE2_41_16]
MLAQLVHQVKPSAQTTRTYGRYGALGACGLREEPLICLKIYSLFSSCGELQMCNYFVVSLCVSTVCSFIFLQNFIRFLGKKTSTQVREYTPQTHQLKGKVPSFGGLVWCIVVPVLCVLAGLRVADETSCSGELLCALLALVLFGVCGFIDDWAKLKKSKGITACSKWVLQWVFAFTIVALWLWTAGPEASFLYSYTWFLPEVLRVICVTLWSAFVMVGVSNAVNLTDGIDGLAGGTSLFVFAGAAFIAYYTCPALLFFAIMLMAALLAFLWFNAYPAKIFMGDIGALSLGAAMGFMFLALKVEFLLIPMGIIFVGNTLSVMLQVASFKLTGKRIFRIAPVHHHFELVGMHESTIVMRAYLITIFMCAVTCALWFCW